MKIFKLTNTLSIKIDSFSLGNMDALKPTWASDAYRLFLNQK